jgi:UDP-N-acetylmuramyl pentapeptide phosphotransferase/UDP-N-acetylglucosamine-1-phosphate transferase
VSVFGFSDLLLAALATVLFVVSYIDDRRGLPISVRLPIHTLAAAAWLAFGPIALPLGVAALAVFAIVWITNLFNFMDGADGLAGGMAVFAFSVYGAVAAASGVMPLALWSIAFAGASAGFLLLNFPPARVFLGDAGSVTLGFFAGVFGIWGWAIDAWPVWFPFLVSAPFFLDATFTLLRRMLRGGAFWRAHREHYYQRLIRSGWSHRRTAACEYIVMAASAGLAVTMLGWSPVAQYIGLAAAGACYVGMAFAIDRRWLRFQQVDDAGALDVSGSAALFATQPAANLRFEDAGHEQESERASSR